MFKYKKARKILSDVNFPGDSDPTFLLAVSKKSERRTFLTSDDVISRQIAASVEIQRVWRGYCVRCKLQSILGVKESKLRFQDQQQEEVFLSSPITAVSVSLQNHAATVIQSWWRSLKHYPSEKNVGGTTGVDTAGNRIGGKENSSVHESGARGGDPTTSKHEESGTRSGKTSSHNVDIRDIETSVDQDGQRKPRKKFNVHVAASVIQRAWRRHNDTKVFDFYRELINFRGRGDPSLMLKSINPKEAQLLDKAAGVHVRFRLGGVRFPPNIYYKIFTHRPIVDLCACSPRDYTAMAYRLQQARDRNNKKPRIPTDNDQCGWYKRHENNGWRMVSDRFFLSPCPDAVTIESSSERQDFHHSRLQRRQDVMKKHKRKKIEWLQKMYREGMVQREEVNRSEIELAAEEMMTLMEKQDVDQVLEQDIDDLLGWTNALNFDEYITEWYSAASSGFSDECHAIYPSQDDRYEITVTNKK